MEKARRAEDVLGWEKETVGLEIVAGWKGP